MDRQDHGENELESGSSFRPSHDTIVLDRRQFLQLAAAAGVAAAGTAAGWHLALAQADAGTEATTSADVIDIVTAMAASLGHDPERIFRFVADEVRYEPYAGILRGANGTLVARAGNSADQAVLLAELLRASDIPVRFATGALDDATTTNLMATTVLDAEAVRERALQSLLSDEDVATGIEWTVPADVPPNEVAALLDLAPLRAALEQDRGELGPRVAGHVQASLDTITGALAGAGVQLPPSQVSAMPSLERERHVWVQAQDGSTWLDLDPSLADLPPGQAAAAAAETLEALPDELRHIVDFTVIAETLTGGALAQEPILGASFFADELAYLGLAFGHARSDDLGGIEGVNLIGSGLSGGTQYNAVLVVGPEAAVGQRSIAIGGSGGTGGGLLGGLGGGGGEGLVEGETSAEWLEVGVTSPGGEPVVARRTIFDRVGTAMRESGVIDVYTIPVAEFVDRGDGYGAQYLPIRAIQAFSVSGATPNVKTLVQELGLEDVGAVSMMAGLFDTLRALLSAELAASLRSLAFADAPAVTSLVVEPTATGTTVGLDIWHRPFGALGVAEMAPSVHPAMLAGVIPHAVERAFMEGDPTPASEPLVTAVSVGAVFEAAAAQGIPTRLLSGSLPVDVVVDPAIQLLLGQALAAGQLVIVPERPVDLGGRSRLGWWLVDPVSGTAVDQMDDGRGTQAEFIADTVIRSSGAIAGGSFLAGVAVAIFAAGIIAFTTAVVLRWQQMERRIEQLERERFELRHPYRPPRRPPDPEQDEED
jgi:hypothetical protein